MTDDFGMQIRCKDRVKTIEPDKKKTLPSPMSELQKENLELKATIQKTQNAIPKLSLCFCDNDDGDNYEIYILRPPSAIRNEKIANAIKKLRQKYSINLLRKAEMNQGIFFPFHQIPESEYERYNKEANNFLTNVEQYFHKRHELINASRRTISLELEVRNTGGKPAEDVDLLIHFPDGFKMYTENDCPSLPVKPTPPQKPRTQAEMIKESMESLSKHPIVPSLDLSDIGPKPPFVLKKTNSYDFTGHFHRIKHGCSEKLPLLFLEFDSYDPAASFSFDYELRPANLPDEKKGTLHVVIEKNGK